MQLIVNESPTAYIDESNRTEHQTKRIAPEHETIKRITNSQDVPDHKLSDTILYTITTRTTGTTDDKFFAALTHHIAEILPANYFCATKFFGTGLDMAAVFDIVYRHKRASIVNDQSNKGTNVHVPPSFAELSSHETRPITSLDAAWQGTGRILIVDDEPLVREFCQVILEDVGFDVLTADDGDEGVETFRQYQDEVALVILDLIMPKLNGVETFKQLKQLRSDVKVIFSSGYGEQLVVSQINELNQARFLQKPYQSTDLTSLVQELLES
ncbi:response regulator [Chloroflexi bacterium TSY]|nr:response regulator [Chloroflexi bacterium TSY]